MGLYPVAVALQQDTTHKITHRTQTKHSTQDYRINKGHTHTQQKHKDLNISVFSDIDAN
jgi:hypothetical protein